MAGERERALAKALERLVRAAPDAHWTLLRALEEAADPPSMLRAANIEYVGALDAARDALALPPDPAPGMEEIERLLKAHEAVLDDGWSDEKPAQASRAALLSAIRALAAPGPDLYAEGRYHGIESMQEQVREAQRKHLDVCPLAQMTAREYRAKAYAEGWRAGVLAAREYLRQIWDDGEQGNSNDAAELLLLEKFAAGPAPEPAPAGPPPVCTGTGTIMTDFSAVMSSMPRDGLCGIGQQRVPLMQDCQTIATHGWRPTLAASPAAPEPARSAWFDPPNPSEDDHCECRAHVASYRDSYYRFPAGHTFREVGRCVHNLATGETLHEARRRLSPAGFSDDEGVPAAPPQEAPRLRPLRPGPEAWQPAQPARGGSAAEASAASIARHASPLPEEAPQCPVGGNEPTPCTCGAKHVGAQCWPCHHQNYPDNCSASYCPEHGTGRSPAGEGEAAGRAPSEKGGGR